MADEQLLRKVHGLGDLELAALLSLIAREHCLISTVPESVDALSEELRLVSVKTFDLAPAVVACHAHTTLDDFATGLLLLPSHLQQQQSAGPPSHSSPTTTRSISPLQTRNEPALSPQVTGSYFLSQPGGVGVGGGGPTHRSAALGSSPLLSTSSSAGTPRLGHQLSSPTGWANGPRIANVVIAKNLDRAPKAVQIQALELLRTRRIFTRTAIHSAPKQFLFIAVVGAASGGQARVTQHLNDYLYVAHWHDPEDGFPRLEEEEEQAGLGNGDAGGSYSGSGHHNAIAGGSSKYLYGSLPHDADVDDRASTASSESVVKRSSILGSSFHSAAGRLSPAAAIIASSSGATSSSEPLLSENDISRLAQLSQQTHVDIDVSRYLLNVVAFLRMHRAVGSGGISPAATKHFEQLARTLAPLHGLDFVTPAIVALAARKIYLHRLRVVAPARERSMQWGSEIEAIEALLEGVGPEEIIEDVLGMVAVPA